MVGLAAVLMVGGAAVASAAPPPYVGGPAEMILGGKRVIEQQTPAVAVYTDKLGIDCSGVLISSDTVLTGAHCVTDEGVVPPKATDTFYVRAGSTDRTQGQVERVSRVTWHPHWDWAHDDIAVLHLAGHVVGVRPAQLAHFRLPYRTIVQLTGWGFERTPLPPPPLPTVEQPPTQLRTVDMQVAPAAHCAGGSIGVHEVCLAPEYVASGACNGDSGGGVMRDGILVGLVSRGTDPLGLCEESNTVATSIPDYWQWIESVKGTA